MSNGPYQVFYAGTASGASSSSYLDLGGKSYTKLAVNAVTMSTGAAITVYGGLTATGTYYPVLERVNTAPVQHQAMTIATTTSGGWACLDSVPFRYIQFITSAVVSGGVSYTVLAYD